MLKFLKEKKAASLMMVFGYSIILFGLSSLLVGSLVSSQKNIGIAERYNMAIYGAESGIEQALFEINTHDIGFNDSTNGKTQYGLIVNDGLLKLNGNRLMYKWGVKGLSDSTTESGYLVWKGNIDNILNLDKNRKKYKNFRKFYLYKDNAGIGESSNSGTIVNICNTDTAEVNFSVNGNSIYTDGDSDKTNIVNWRLDVNEDSADGTGYYLQSSQECSYSGDQDKNPFCYKINGTFSHNGKLEFDSTNTIGHCLTNAGDDCKDQSIVDLLDGGGDPLNGNPFKPVLTLTYQNYLYENGDDINGLPIHYEISGCTEPLPSLVQEITSTAQVYGSVQTITRKIYQGTQGIDLSYTIIQ
ncbi:hypothetical protein LR002_00885 [Candidatus Gracilibacteria bacterium]|nr:hypothetical protein [Candidatus Gracilibacteria bacterium]